jgi:hypothetical protein
MDWNFHMAEFKNWSYSAATTYEQCGRKYYHLYVAKDVKQDNNSEALLYGNAVHAAAEAYIGKGKPLPEKFSQFQKVLDKIKTIPGEKVCEHKLGLTKDLKPCGFFDSNVFWRGAIDLLILDREKGLATVIDYKTNKSSERADTRQLSLLSYAVFKHYPEIKIIKSGLVFLVAEDLVKEQYHVDNAEDLWGEWQPLLQRIETSYETGVFNASPNFLCKNWCPVKSCAHNGK